MSRVRGGALLELRALKNAYWAAFRRWTKAADWLSLPMAEARGRVQLKSWIGLEDHEVIHMGSSETMRRAIDFMKNNPL